MKRNLVPPSYFHCDSSSQNVESKSHVLGQDTKRTSASFKPTLKTPNDFRKLQQTPSVALQHSPGYARHLPLPPNAGHLPLPPNAGSFSSPQQRSIISQDSGYECERSKGSGDCQKSFQQLFDALKEENKNLQDLLQKNFTEKDSKCNYNVITHQVQYIERLQQDLSETSNKLNQRESLVGKLEVEMQEKDFHIQQQHVKTNQLSKELQEEQRKIAQLTDDLTSMKASLIAAATEKERLFQEHSVNVQEIHQKHEEEINEIYKNKNTEMQILQQQFKREKELWQQTSKEEKASRKSEEQARFLENQNKFDEKLKQIEAENARYRSQNDALHKETKDFNKDKNDLKNEIASLQAKLQSCQQRVQCSQDEARELSVRLEKEKETSSQLRTYIAQVQSEEHDRSQWKNEKIKMESTLDTLRDEKEELKKTLEMLNVRFQSVSKILEMQEQAITAHTSAIPAPHDQRSAAVVTTQWRSKVFELMVQCKTQEIIAKEDEYKHKVIEKEFNRQIRDQSRELEIVANQMRDVEAQLELRNHQNSTLEANNEKQKQNVGALKEKSLELESALEKLKAVVKTMSETYIQSYEENLAACLDKCLRMEQRLAFANNRVRSIQDLLKRKETMWRVRLQQADEKGDKPADEKKRKNSDLCLEVQQLTEERNSLSQQLSHDAAQFEKTIQIMKKNEASCLQTNRDLENKLASYDEKIQDLTAQLALLQASLDDEKYEKDEIVAELQQAKLATKKDVDDALEIAKQQHYQELKEQETAINQVKRDLTKAVVSLRQAERSSVREKNQLTEQLEAERKLWLDEEEKLRTSIRNLQKDNNLLMTTLRQEGLMSAFKAARACPIVPSEEAEVPLKRVQFACPSSGEKDDNKQKKTADVDKMLQDLTNLSEKVLADSDCE